MGSRALPRRDGEHQDEVVVRALAPGQLSMDPGDTVEVRIEGIGTLKNRLV